uniref:Uncharacterized protein n=1 Tax=Rhizophora mucronata TaxID=61149 RepID=A0A2P2QVP1_RHIMU
MMVEMTPKCLQMNFISQTHGEMLLEENALSTKDQIMSLITGRTRNLPVLNE